MKNRGNRIESLDTLRGLAALSVCWYHFTGSSLVAEGLLKDSGTYGWLGVHCFFVVSGFVIPYTPHRDNYKLRHYTAFVLKRLARIYPPYLASLAVALGLLVLYGIYSGQPRVDLDSDSLLLHLALLNGLVGEPWLGSIYWTLAIEVQFYLLLGLMFPLLFSARTWLRLLTYLLLILSAKFAIGSPTVFGFVLLFLIGIVTAQYFLKQFNLVSYLLLLTIFSVITYQFHGLAIVLASLVSVGGILFLQKGSRVTNFLGRVSYSFYLLHSSLGSLILFILLNFVFGQGQAQVAIGLVSAILLTFAMATLAYYLIERPAIKSSHQFNYDQPTPAQVSLPPATESLVQPNNR